MKRFKIILVTILFANAYSCANLSNVYNIMDEEIYVDSLNQNKTYVQELISINNLHLQDSEKCDTETMLVVDKIYDMFKNGGTVSGTQISSKSDHNIYYLGTLYSNEDLHSYVFYRITTFGLEFSQKQILLVNVKKNVAKSLVCVAEKNELDGVSVESFSQYNPQDQSIKTKCTILSFDTGKVKKHILRNNCKIIDDGFVVSSYIDTSFHKPIISETIPEFDGDLRSFVMSNLKYPDKAKADGIEGVVYVQFEVDTMGKTLNHIVIKSPNQILNEEAIIVTQKISFIKPATRNNKPINYTMILPIRFVNEHREQ